MNPTLLITTAILCFLLGLLIGDLLGFDRGWQRHKDIAEIYGQLSEGGDR